MPAKIQLEASARSMTAVTTGFSSEDKGLFIDVQRLYYPRVIEYYNEELLYEKPTGGLVLEFIPASSGGPQQTFQMAVSIAAQLAVEAGVSADVVGIVAISWRRNTLPMVANKLTVRFQLWFSSMGLCRRSQEVSTGMAVASISLGYADHEVVLANSFETLWNHLRRHR